MTAEPSVSPADTPRDLRRAAEYVVASGDTATAANWLRTAADAIESRNALLHGADVDHAALLAVGERDKAEIEALNDRNKWRWPAERARAQRYQDALRQIAAHPHGGILVNIARAALKEATDAATS